MGGGRLILLGEGLRHESDAGRRSEGLPCHHPVGEEGGRGGGAWCVRNVYIMQCDVRRLVRPRQYDMDSLFTIMLYLAMAIKNNLRRRLDLHARRLLLYAETHLSFCGGKTVIILLSQNVTQ